MLEGGGSGEFREAAKDALGRWVAEQDPVAPGSPIFRGAKKTDSRANADLCCVENGSGGQLFVGNLESATRWEFLREKKIPRLS